MYHGHVPKVYMFIITQFTITMYHIQRNNDERRTLDMFFQARKIQNVSLEFFINIMR